MKVSKFFGMLMAMAMVASFASCGDDDDDDNSSSSSAADAVMGTYYGEVSSTLMDTTYTDTLIIVKVSDNEVAISSVNPDAKLKGVVVAATAEGYSLTEGDDFYEEIGMSMSSAMPTSYYSSDNSTGKQLNDLLDIEGSVVGNNLSINFGGAPGAMPMQIDYKFVGSKK